MQSRPPLPCCQLPIAESAPLRPPTCVCVSSSAAAISTRWLTLMYGLSAKHWHRRRSWSPVKLVLDLLVITPAPRSAAARRRLSRGSGLTMLAAVVHWPSSHTSIAAAPRNNICIGYVS